MFECVGGEESLLAVGYNAICLDAEPEIVLCSTREKALQHPVIDF